MKFRITIFLIFLIVIGCEVAPCSWNWGYEQLERRVKSKDVVGLYKLDDVSKEFLQEKKFKSGVYQITLKGNGRFVMNGAPDFILNRDGQTREISTDRSGKWSLSFSKTYGCMIVLQNTCVMRLNKKQGRYGMLIPIDKETDCHGLVYEKIK